MILTAEEILIDEFWLNEENYMSNEWKRFISIIENYNDVDKLQSEINRLENEVSCLEDENDELKDKIYELSDEIEELKDELKNK